MKMTLGIVALVAVVIGLAVGRAEGQAKPQPSERSIGRWQLVQGPPAGVYRTFLVDTATGATYIVCGEKGENTGVDGWCPMPFIRPPIRPAQ